jgi:hypothetical protein
MSKYVYLYMKKEVAASFRYKKNSLKMSLSWGMCPLVEAENTLLDEDEREAAEDRNTILETRLF